MRSASPNRSHARLIAFVLAVMLLGSVVPAALGAPAASAPASGAGVPAPAAVAAGPMLDVPENGTNSGSGAPNGSTQRVYPGNGNADGPPIAEQARVTPVRLQQKYSTVEVRQQDAVYGVSGEFLILATTRDVTAARIANSKAAAQVQDGGQTVKIEFADDAAVKDKESFYQLELFFEDESKRVIDLYVTNTDVTVVDAQLANARDLVNTMIEDAEAHGYEPTLEGALEYHEWEKDQADIFDNLFGPELERFLGAMLGVLSSAFALLFFAVLFGLLLWRQVKVHGWKIRHHQNTPNLMEQKRREIELAYRDQQHAADEEPLEDIPEIGRDHIYWNDMGVSSVKDLADEFAFGRPRTTANGELVRDTSAEPLRNPDGSVMTFEDGETPVYPVVWEHRGVRDLWEAVEEGRSLRDTWLEPMLRPDMLRSEQSALAHGKRALLRMTTKFGQPQYSEARSMTARLLEDLADGPNATGKTSRLGGSTSYSGSSGRTPGGPGTGGTPAGDD